MNPDPSDNSKTLRERVNKAIEGISQRKEECMLTGYHIGPIQNLGYTNGEGILKIQELCYHCECTYNRPLKQEESKLVLDYA